MEKIKQRCCSTTEKTMLAKYRHSILRNKGLSALLVMALILATTISASAQDACGGIMIFDSGDVANVSGACVGSAVTAEFYKGASGDCSDPDSYTQLLVNAPTTVNGDPILDATHSIQTYERVQSAFGPSVSPPTVLPNDKEILLQASGSSSNVYRFNVPEAVLEQSDTSRIRIDVPNPTDTVIVNVLGGGPKLVGSTGFGAGGIGAWTNNGIVSNDAYSHQVANNTPYNSASQYMGTFFDHDPSKLIFNFPDATNQDFVQLGEWTSNIYGTYIAPCGDIQMKNVGFELQGAVIADGAFGWSANNQSLPNHTPFTGVAVGEAVEVTPIPPTAIPPTAVPVPSIDLIKTASTDSAEVGDTVIYTYTVINTGDVPLETVTIDDDKLGTIAVDLEDGALGTAGQFDTAIVTATYVVQESDVGADGTGSITNVANATGTTAGGQEVSDEDTVTITTALILPTLGSIGDTIYNDDNGNGVQDTGELGLGGVMITITDSDGVERSETTAPDGSYSFTGLVLGEYTVMVDATTLPVGKTNASNSGNPDGGDDGTSTATLTEAEPDDNGQDFGYVSGSIGDTIYHDENGNGVQDAGEPGLTGVDVTLTGPDGSTTASTDSDGTYLFSDLPMGDYTITIDPATLPADKQGAANTGDPDGGTGSSSSITLSDDPSAPNIDDLEQDFGYQLVVGTIGDTIYHDENGNGVQDAGEPGLAGVDVTLTGPDGPMTATTDDSGTYMFSDLPMGDYTITVDPDTLPADKQGANNTGDPNGDMNNSSSVTLSDNPEALNLSDLDQDFGYQIVGSIGDTIFHDLNGDGDQDTGEPGLAGVDVTLTGPNGSATVTTDENGFYMFSDLPMGDYVITVEISSLPEDKQGANNTADPDDGDSNMSSVTLAADGVTDNPDQDFGYLLTVPTGSIGRVIYHDLNRNGTQDADEPGLSGVQLTLSDAAGNTIEIVNTGSDGSYLFDELPIDADYTVTINTSTLPGDKLDSFNSGDPDGGNDATSAVRLDEANGINNVDQNFGFVSDQILGSVGDFVYSITREGNEPLSGVLLTLTSANGVVYTTTTDTSGLYLFSDVPLDDYTLEVDESTLPEEKQGRPPAYVSDNGDDSITNFTLNAAVPNDLTQDFAYADPTSVTLSSVGTDSYSVGLMLSWVVMMVGTAVIVTRRAS